MMLEHVVLWERNFQCNFPYQGRDGEYASKRETYIHSFGLIVFTVPANKPRSFFRSQRAAMEEVHALTGPQPIPVNIRTRTISFMELSRIGTGSMPRVVMKSPTDPSITHLLVPFKYIGKNLNLIYRSEFRMPAL